MSAGMIGVKGDVTSCACGWHGDVLCDENTIVGSLAVDVPVEGSSLDECVCDWISQDGDILRYGDAVVVADFSVSIKRYGRVWSIVLENDDAQIRTTLAVSCRMCECHLDMPCGLRSNINLHGRMFLGHGLAGLSPSAVNEWPHPHVPLA